MTSTQASGLEDGPLHPRENPNLVGHEKAENAFLEAFRSKRLPHAWLICGSRGIGKATLAYRFARFLLTQGMPEENGAGSGTLFDDSVTRNNEAIPRESALYVSPSDLLFRRVAAGGHGGLLVIEKGSDDKGKLRSEIVVGDVRKIAPFLALTSAEGGWRVVLIDGADEMNQSASNALLKVLEEPPARAVFLLVTHRAGKIFATVRSRCRRLVVDPLDEGDVASMLVETVSGLGSEDARALARLSEGSIGKALSLADGGGLKLYRDLFSLLESLPDTDTAALHKLCDKVGGGADAQHTFDTISGFLVWWLGKLVLFAAGAGGETSFIEAAQGEKALAERLSRTAGLDRLLGVWEKLTTLLARVASANLDRKQVLLTIFLSLEDAARR
jgi:DNA polymerase III subunit delta'